MTVRDSISLPGRINVRHVCNLITSAPPPFLVNLDKIKKNRKEPFTNLENSIPKANTYAVMSSFRDASGSRFRPGVSGFKPFTKFDFEMRTTRNLLSGYSSDCGYEFQFQV